MRIASFLHKGRTSFGAILGDRISDLGGLERPGARDLQSVLAHDDSLETLKSLCEAGLTDIGIDEIRLLPPVPKPSKIICIGVNYKSHIVECGMTMPEHPWVFTRFSNSVVGHREAIVRPTASTHYDYEGELALVIGKSGRQIKKSDALRHIFGYSCFNDGSVRDFQNHTDQYTPGKNFWRSGSFGPWIVTTDEIDDPNRLQLTTKLNGETMQSASVGDLYFDIPTLIEYCSTFTELEPGDVIVTGTPGGVGFARTPPVWLKAGDKLEVEISQIGTLRNTVEDES